MFAALLTHSDYTEPDIVLIKITGTIRNVTINRCKCHIKIRT